MPFQLSTKATPHYLGYKHHAELAASNSPGLIEQCIYL